MIGCMFSVPDWYSNANLKMIQCIRTILRKPNDLHRILSHRSIYSTSMANRFLNAIRPILRTRRSSSSWFTPHQKNSSSTIVDDQTIDHQYFITIGVQSNGTSQKRDVACEFKVRSIRLVMSSNSTYSKNVLYEVIQRTSIFKL